MLFIKYIKGLHELYDDVIEESYKNLKKYGIASFFVSYT